MMPWFKRLQLLSLLLPYLTLHRLSFTMDDSIGCHNAVRGRIGLYYLELHRMHCLRRNKEVSWFSNDEILLLLLLLLPLCAYPFFYLSDEEEVTLGHRAVGLQEIRLEVHIEQVTSHALQKS